MNDKRHSDGINDDAYHVLLRQTVHETLMGLGFDVRDPNKLQADMYYLRKMRSGSEEMTNIVRRSAITLGFTTALYLIWEAVKMILQR